MPSSKEQFIEYYYASSDDEEAEPPMLVKDKSRRLRRWVDENYDALQELYDVFKRTGEQLFGRVHYQNGGFHTFARHVFFGINWEYTFE